VVIGGGPGGYAAALYGASAGLKVACVEKDKVGGTCLHRGCIPAKEFLETASVYRHVAGAKEFGIEAGQPGRAPGQGGAGRDADRPARRPERGDGPRRARAGRDLDRAVGAGGAAVSPGRIVVELGNGVTFGFPPARLPELRRADTGALADVAIDPMGAGLRWERLDVDYEVGGLLRALFGSGWAMRQLASIGGSARSVRKARSTPRMKSSIMCEYESHRAGIREIFFRLRSPSWCCQCNYRLRRNLRRAAGPASRRKQNRLHRQRRREQDHRETSR